MLDEELEEYLEDKLENLEEYLEDKLDEQGLE